MRLIDADALHMKNGYSFQAQLEIDNAPTVDAEVVVRCKDCYQSVAIGNVLHCTYWRKNTDENGYCHEGG